MAWTAITVLHPCEPSGRIEIGDLSRADMDSYAQRPQELAVQSQKSGFFDRAIAPVTLADGTVVATDDGPRASSTLEKLSQLPEAFAGGGA